MNETKKPGLRNLIKIAVFGLLVAGATYSNRGCIEKHVAPRVDKVYQIVVDKACKADRYLESRTPEPIRKFNDKVREIQEPLYKVFGKE